MNRMSPQDATFLHIENDSSPMHIGCVGHLRGPAGAFSTTRLRWSRASSPAGASLRQVVRFLVRCACAPVWVDDPHFALGYRLRRTALPLRAVRGVAGAGRAGDVAAAGPLAAPVGDVGHRGARATTLGAPLEDPPLDGRRGLRLRSDHRATRREAPRPAQPAGVWIPARAAGRRPALGERSSTARAIRSPRPSGLVGGVRDASRSPGLPRGSRPRGGRAAGRRRDPHAARH